MEWAPYVLLLAGIAFGTRWWLPRRSRLLADAGGVFAVQLVIWLFAEEMDNGVPWNPNRPLLTTDSDGLLFQLVAFLLLYGPLTIGLYFIWKARD